MILIERHNLTLAPLERAEFTEKVKPEVVIDFERFFVSVSTG